jgi:hypothetical protein
MQKILFLANFFSADVSIRYHYIRKQMDMHTITPKTLEAITNRYGFLEEDENGKALNKYKLTSKGAWKRYEQERDRAKRWNTMIVNWDSWIKNRKSKVFFFHNPKIDISQVQKRIGKGLPDSLRGEAWKRLCGADKARKENPQSYAVS